MTTKTRTGLYKSEDWYRDRLADLYKQFKDTKDPELSRIIEEIEDKWFHVLQARPKAQTGHHGRLSKVA